MENQATTPIIKIQTFSSKDMGSALILTKPGMVTTHTVVQRRISRSQTLLASISPAFIAALPPADRPLAINFNKQKKTIRQSEN